MNIRTHLNDRNVPYNLIEHRDTYRSRDTVNALREEPDFVAKTVLLKTMKGYVVAVLPASCQVDLRKAAMALGVEKVALATEREMQDVFYDCEPGIVPAFGSLYSLKTLVDPFLEVVPAMFIEGNNHHESIKLSFRDFRRIEHPIVARIAYAFRPSNVRRIGGDEWH